MTFVTRSKCNPCIKAYVVCISILYTADIEACLPNQLQCGNGNCIDTSLKCDGSDDCGDNSDEIDCGMWTISYSSFALCFAAMFRLTCFIGHK